MVLNLKDIIKKLDYLCFILTIIGAIPLVAFEFTTIKDFYVSSIAVFLVVFVIYISVIILRFVANKKFADNQDYVLTKFEKIRYSIFFILSILCVIWFTFILFKL